MKKTLNILFVILLLSTSMLFAADKVKVEATVSDRAENAGQGPGGSATDDLYDLQFEYPCAVATGEAGVETDGNYIYTTEWNGAAGFFRYELDGTYVGTFNIAGAGNVRDLAYDGQYFYGAAANNSLFEMDFTPGAETLISTITAPVACRAIAYDPVNDGFWANNWSDAITLFDRSGTTLDSFACGAMISFYGFAWEDVLPGGPYLWGSSQSGTGNDLVKMDLANGGAQVEVYDIANSGITYAAGDICGGLYITDALVPGKWTIGGIVQNVSIWGLELADSAPLDAPGVPTGVTVVPDAGGALEVDIDWICPDVTVNGDPLTDLDEMEVYRDDALIYTDSSPTIGGAGSYTDAAVPASGNYAYKVVGVNTAGEGLPVIISTWVGEDVPNVVEDLLLEADNGDGVLTWVNPTTGLNGGAFNEAILGYHIERNDGVVFEVTGETTEYTDDTIPAADYYDYTVVAYNSVGDGGSATSNTVLIGAGDEIFFDDFEDGLVNWTLENNGQPGGFTIYGAGAYPNAYTLPATSSGNVCAADADEVYPIDSEIVLVTPLDLSTYTTANIQFDNDWQAIGASDFAYVDVSVDGGSNWTNVLTFDEVDVRQTHEIIDITTIAAGQSNVLVRFASVQPGWDWWWAIDNVGVYATGEEPVFDPPVNLAVDDMNMFTWEAPGGGGDVEELMYDSGVSTGAYSYVGYSMGVQMSPASSCQILELKIHTSEGTEFNAEVWGWDAGAPTEDLYYQALTPAAMDDWVVVDVSGENLMMDGDFVVAFGSLNAVTYMSYDTTNNGRAWDHADAGGWATWNESYFCRAVVQYADGSIAELAPTPIVPANQAFVAGEKVSIDVVDHNVDASRELESYDVYLDGTMLGNTTDLFWQFTDLEEGVEYEAGVVAVYTDGTSEMVTILFNAAADANNNTIGISTALNGNYPNPFNPVTNIAYSIQETGNVTLEVYNLRGQLVKTLVNDVQEAGEHTQTWNGTNDSGKSVASGVYFYKMKASNYTATKKMILMK